MLVEGRTLITDLAHSRWALLNLCLTPLTLSREMDLLMHHLHGEPHRSLLALLPSHPPPFSPSLPSPNSGVSPSSPPRVHPSVLRFPAPLLSRLSSTVSCSGYVAEFAVPPPAPLLASVSTVVLDGVSDPVNVGLIARSGAAFGFAQLLTRSPSAHALSQKAIAASAGSLGRVHVHRWEGEGERVLREGRRAGLSTAVGLVAKGGMGVDDVVRLGRRRGGAAAWWLLVGSESGGLSEQLSARCDALLTLPLHPDVDSLNAATAAAIACYALTQR